jgi:AraC-like DNA-binding protein
MSAYRELRPPAALSGFVECFWTHTASERAVRVLPDTCVDLIFSRERGLQFVGTMTRSFLDQVSDERLFGARLHAATVRAFFNINVGELNDRVVSMQDLVVRVGEIEDGIQTFQRLLVPQRPLTPMQRAVRHLARAGGKVRLDAVCESTGLSARQFRRRCIEECGIGPKQLARISRFRNACRVVASSENPHWATLALDCGYSDQPHFTREFQQFSGMMPREYGAYCRA